VTVKYNSKDETMKDMFCTIIGEDAIFEINSNPIAAYSDSIAAYSDLIVIAHNINTFKCKIINVNQIDKLCDDCNNFER
jgi:hypothetical protein